MFLQAIATLSNKPSLYMARSRVERRSMRSRILSIDGYDLYLVAVDNLSPHARQGTLPNSHLKMPQETCSVPSRSWR